MLPGEPLTILRFEALVGEAIALDVRARRPLDALRHPQLPGPPAGPARLSDTGRHPPARRPMPWLPRRAQSPMRDSTAINSNKAGRFPIHRCLLCTAPYQRPYGPVQLHVTPRFLTKKDLISSSSPVRQKPESLELPPPCRCLLCWPPVTTCTTDMGPAFPSLRPTAHSQTTLPLGKSMFTTNAKLGASSQVHSGTCSIHPLIVNRLKLPPAPVGHLWSSQIVLRATG
ncbi:hypothetical protein BDV95DRAFT_48296 [Massariosphaeria phaeospora]|uniref:Uncharacterized protein n=1 Tax=Massariosphaeria phaeospora TaxID=100035 RepID=A0A7C8I638_9PLEO|nr:hypothetical protein BDV95DRAFT_48296 [Massariosphaeria phaeospora]